MQLMKSKTFYSKCVAFCVFFTVILLQLSQFSPFALPRHPMPGCHSQAPHHCVAFRNLLPTLCGQESRGLSPDSAHHGQQVDPSCAAFWKRLVYVTYSSPMQLLLGWHKPAVLYREHKGSASPRSLCSQPPPRAPPTWAQRVRMTSLRPITRPSTALCQCEGQRGGLWSIRERTKQQKSILPFWNVQNILWI